MADDTAGKARSPERIRPQLVAQQSNSVPSTPQQRPRQAPTGARTPSPVNRRASHSPRTVASDSAKSREQYRTGPVVTECRFKTTQPSRRRIPYSIGDQVLDKPHESPKHRLTHDEHNRLGNNIERVYHTLLPSQPGQGRREQVLEKLRRIIGDGFPGRDFGVQVFGSSGNLLFTDQSDGMGFWRSYGRAITDNTQSTSASR